MAFEIIQGWKGFDKFTREQHHTVGMVGITPDGRRASYVELVGGRTYQLGELVDDIGDPGGTVRAASAVDENILRGATNPFGSFAWNDAVGAFGFITQGTGQGQFFVVERMRNETAGDMFIRRWYESRGDNRATGWATAIGSSDQFSLRLPGRVTGPASAGNSLNLRGVLQAEIEVPSNEFRYGWVLQAGIGWGRLAAGGLDVGELVIQAGGGNMRVATTTAIDVLSRAVGRAVLDGPGTGFAAGDLALIDFNIVNNAVSARKADRGYIFSRIDA